MELSVLEKTLEVPYWTAPITLSNTPLVTWLQERERTHACPDSGSAGVSGGEHAGLCATSPRGAAQSATGSFRLHRAKCSRHGEPGTRGQRVRARHRREQPEWD